MTMIYGFKKYIMKLTIKDKEIIEKLKNLFENKEILQIIGIIFHEHCRLFSRIVRFKRCPTYGIATPF
jgi:hypothetical protein